MQNIAVLRHAGRGSDSIEAQFSDFARVVAGICTQVSSDEWRCVIFRRLVKAQWPDLSVARGSSVVDQINNMRMVEVLQSVTVIRLPVAEVFSITTQFNDLTMVDAC